MHALRSIGPLAEKESFTVNRYYRFPPPPSFVMSKTSDNCRPLPLARNNICARARAIIYHYLLSKRHVSSRFVPLSFSCGNRRRVARFRGNERTIFLQMQSWSAINYLSRIASRYICALPSETKRICTV